MLFDNLFGIEGLKGLTKELRRKIPKIKNEDTLLKDGSMMTIRMNARMSSCKDSL
jgi:hypothetical protein